MTSERRVVPRSAGGLARTVVSLVLVAAWHPGVARTAPVPGVAAYQYLSPVPGSRWVSRWNNVVFREGDVIDRATVDAASLSVVGSASGRHDGTLVLSDDSRTWVFEPRRPFAPGETVDVTLGTGPKVVGRKSLPAASFRFTVASRDPVPARRSPDDRDPGRSPGTPWSANTPAEPCANGAGPMTAALPPGYPTFNVLANDNPDSGYVFLTPRVIGSTAAPVIIDNHAMPIYYRHASYNLLDFKLQPNGQLTYYDAAWGKSYAMNSAFAVVDSFAPKNGYILDFHDLQIMPNGHCLLLANETIPVGMDTVVAGGDPEAMVMGFVIQELDAAKHVVFQWRTFDHFKITDAVHVDLTASWIDYVHMNSVALDADGNLLVSSRHMNEITKINHQTGAIIWRLGRNAVNNQFTFVNDARGFAYQHDARRLPNGHITLFDNGNFLNPQTSRAVEYALDENAKVATLVWQAEPTVPGWGSSGGGVQRRSDGSTMICWGAGPIAPRMTDLHADGTKAFEVDFMPDGTTSYRAFRWPWRSTRYVTDTQRLDFGSVRPGDVGVQLLRVTNNTNASLAITSFVLLDSTRFRVQESAPITIPRRGQITVHVRFLPDTLRSFQSTLYVHSDNDSVVMAQDVALEGTGIPGVLDVRVLSPNGGESFTIGDNSDIAWTAADSIGMTTVDVCLSRNGAGGPFETVASGLANTGHYTWRVDAPTTSAAFVKIVARDQGWDQGQDMSDGEFRIMPHNNDVDDEPVGHFALTRVAPNPAREGARVEFAVARSARVRVSVLDVQGRTVAVLVDGIRPRGRYSASWDCRAGAQRAPQGVYHIRYENPERIIVRAVAVLR